MHEDAPGLAPALAIVALSAARDRLALGGGARLRVTRAVPLGPERHPPDPPPLPPRAARGWELARGRLGCFACHRDDGRGNGPSLVGVGERYLTRYGSTEEAGEALARFLRAPRPEASLAGGSWPARMPALSEVACSDEELGRLVDFLLSARGTRPVSELR
ncbi:MAG: hypothetical protein D6731_11200 [Planctomycetota bacterium]|nr:MAG: hypothetical protein D6731_11200 [Planctomycetota bacterium]